MIGGGARNPVSLFPLPVRDLPSTGHKRQSFPRSFGFSSGPLWLSVLFLAGSGAADMISMILRGMVIQLTTPDEFRGRMSAVNGMFVVGGPMLGQFESGVVAGIVSPQFSSYHS